MISDRLIKTDIPVLDLIYGEIKNMMYEVDQEAEALNQSDSEEAEIRGYELDAKSVVLAYLYNEIDRVMSERAKIPAEQLEKTY